MAQRVSLDDVSGQQFDQLAEILSRSLSDRLVTIRFWTASFLELGFDSAWMSDLLESHQLPVDPCLGQLSADIPIMLSALLSGTSSSAVRHLASNTELTDSEVDAEDEEKKELIRTELGERFTILERVIVNDDLRNRYSIKSTAKNNFFTGVDWEIVQRQSDNTDASSVGMTYAMVRFITQKPHSPLARSRPENEALTVIFTVDEIFDLKAILENVYNAIGKSAEGGANS